MSPLQQSARGAVLFAGPHPAWGVSVAPIGAAIAGYRLGDDLSDDVVLVFNAALALTALVYETLLVGFFGRTVGKIVMGTRIVRRVDGGRVSWWSALQRSLVPVVASSVPQAGFVLGPMVYVFAFFSPLRQGVHDRAAGTVVVMDRRQEA